MDEWMVWWLMDEQIDDEWKDNRQKKRISISYKKRFIFRHLSRHPAKNVHFINSLQDEGSATFHELRHSQPYPVLLWGLWGTINIPTSSVRKFWRRGIWEERSLAGSSSLFPDFMNMSPVWYRLPQTCMLRRKNLRKAGSHHFRGSICSNSFSLLI